MYKNRISVPVQEKAMLYPLRWLAHNKTDFVDCMISRMKGGAFMAMNNFALNNVYNTYLTTYAPKGTTPFDTHKKSELRSVYNSIVKMNKDAPLTIPDTSKESQKFAVSIKEESRGLYNVIASLGGIDEESMLNKKVAYSSNDSIASAKYVGDNNSEDKSADVPSFEISVQKLAGPQVNTGDYLPSSKSSMTPGDYSFDVGVNDLNYEFQFSVANGDTNKNTQDKLSRLINKSNIGITASVLEDGSGNSALKLMSNATGLPDDKTSLFTISDERTSKTAGSVDYFGIADTTRFANNAQFSLNGQSRTASSNNFTVEKTYEINLNGISSDSEDSATIGLKTDTESLTENVSHLITGYNSFITAANQYVETQPKGGQLISEMKSISSYYKNDLQSAGLNINDDGTIDVNKDLLTNSVEEGNGKEALSSIKNFTNSLVRKTNQVSLDPMNYVKKTIVAYKNPGKNFSSPYTSSTYSGMMFNSYC